MGHIKINDKQKQLYIEKGYWTNKTLLDYWNTSVKNFANREFVVDDKGCRYTYKELDEQSSILAGYLAKIGIGPNDVVSYQMPVWSEFVLICIACLKVGAIMNPIGRRYGPKEIKCLLNLMESKLFICPTCFRNKNYEKNILSIRDEVKSLAHIILVDSMSKKESETITIREILETYQPLKKEAKVSSNDIATILCTSGTTGGSKGVMLTHNNIIFSEKQFAKELGLTEEDIMFMAAPLHHATGFHHGIILPMLLGGKAVLQGQFKADDAIKLMNQEGCTYSMGSTPFIYDILEDLRINGGGLETLKFFLCGGASVPGDMVHRASQYGIKLCEVYGSTESVPHVFVRPEEVFPLMKSTSGRAMEGVEVRIVDEKGEDVPVGVIGEEISRGPNVFVGYFKDGEGTDKALDDDGWFYSGDLCVGDELGNIKIMGRKKDMIVRGGENLNLNEICENIMGCPCVHDQAVIGMPDERLGERICAYLVLNPDVDNLELSQVLDYLENKKVPKRFWPERIEIIDHIPRTDSGKVKKFLLEEDIRKKTLTECKNLFQEVKLDKNTFSPQRSKATTKPKVEGPEIVFYYCKQCMSIIQSIETQSQWNGLCCNKHMVKLKAKKAEEVTPMIAMDYKIMGGYNQNVIEVSWKEKQEDIIVKWIYLKTFTGGQIKHVTNKIKKSFVFALADEDAYVYCDESPCVECTFRCKRGFEIYAYIQPIGLVKMPLDRMNYI